MLTKARQAVRNTCAATTTLMLRNTPRVCKSAGVSINVRSSWWARTAPKSFALICITSLLNKKRLGNGLQLTTLGSPAWRCTPMLSTTSRASLPGSFW